MRISASWPAVPTSCTCTSPMPSVSSLVAQIADVDARRALAWISISEPPLKSTP